jgi:hypothetical protein
VYQNPACPTISQNQSFLGPFSLIPQPSIACHAGSTSLVTAIHTGVISPTSASHVKYRSTTSASHVEDQQPVTANHVGGTTLVTASHIGKTSPTSASHVGDVPLASASHARNMSPSIASHVGGINMIDKPRRIRHKPKFLCIIFNGGHINHLFPVVTGLIGKCRHKQISLVSLRN